MQYFKILQTTLAYSHTPGRSPGILFCGGFSSDMTSTKVVELESWACSQGIAFTRFDYSGHGASSGNFTEGTIGTWYSDTLAILDNIPEGPQMIVGSSMGGWIMLLVTLARRTRIVGLVGIAAAPDFTEDLIWNVLDPVSRQRLLEEGMITQPCNEPEESPLTITSNLITEARNHLLLHKPINISCPVHLIHGLQDKDVPWETSLRLLNVLQTPNVKLSLIKDGTHRLSRPEDIQILKNVVSTLYAQITS